MNLSTFRVKAGTTLNVGFPGGHAKTMIEKVLKVLKPAGVAGGWHPRSGHIRTACWLKTSVKPIQLNVQGLDINFLSIPNRTRSSPFPGSRPQGSKSTLQLPKKPKMRSPNFRIHFQLLEKFQDFINLHPLNPLNLHSSSFPDTARAICPKAP